MTWFDLAIATTTAAAIVLLPGLAVTLALGLRGLRLWGLAAPAGVTVICLAAVAAPLVGLRWSVVPVLISNVVVAGAALAIRLLIGGRTRGGAAKNTQRDGRLWGATIPVVGAGVLIAVQVLVIMGDPGNISQTFDNVFHLNAIRYAVDEGNASPLFLASMTSGEGPAPFYPSGWHAVASLVVATTSVAVPTASNAVMLVFAAVVWPASILLLVRELRVVQRPGMFAAAAAAAAFPAFPLLMLEYGVLYPFMMGLSLVPAALAVVVRLCFPDGRERALLWALILLGILPGIAIAHPGALVALFALSTVVLALAGVIAGRAASTSGARWVIVAAAAAYTGLLVVVWYALRPEDLARSWLPHETVAQAIGEVVAVAPWDAPVNVAMTILVAVGVVAALRRRSVQDVAVLMLFVASALLYVVASGLPYLDLRDLLVGPWYNNAPRLAAILPVAWVPLAAIGAEWAWGAARAWQSAHPGLLSSRALALVAAGLILVILPQGWTMRQAVSSAAPLYRFDEDSPLVTRDELALIERLPDEVPEDAIVVGSPWTGVAVTYALTGREVLMPHTLTTTTPEADLINDGLRSARPGSEVCEAVDDIGARFVLDFGTQEVHGATHVYPGIRNLASSGAVELVDSEGEARLYRVVACDR